MRGIVGGIALSALFGLAFLAAVARSQEKLTPDKVPQKVMAAVKAKFPTPEFTQITKEIVDGQVVYDLEFNHKGRKCEMDIKEDGTVINIEREVAAKDLPAAVTKALEKKYPKATLKEIMEIKDVKGNEEVPGGYEVILETADKKTLEVTVSPDGKTITEAGEEKKEKK